MGIFRREKRSTLSQPEGWLVKMIGAEAASGVEVNPETAMRATAVYACVSLLAELVASMPLFLYRRKNEGRERASEHYLYRVLHDEPNPYMTSFGYWESAMVHLLTYGNHYAEKGYDSSGRVQQLWPISPNRVAVKALADGTMYYEVSLPSGEKRKVSFDKIFHIPGPGFDGRVGRSPIAMNREAVGLSIAMERYSAKFFSNDATPRSVLVYPGQVDEEMEANIRESWQKKHGGTDNAHRIAILEEGLKVERVGLPQEDMEFIESRKYQTEEIARIYRVPLHLIQHQEKTTSWGTGVEQLGIGFVQYTMRPWLVRIERAIHQRLLSDADKDKYYAEFLVDGLLRGDAKSRAEALQIWRLNGVINANEWRQLENMNPVEGGDEYWRPANMMPPRDSQEPRQIVRRSKDVQPRRRLMRTFEPLIRESASVVVKRQMSDIANLAKKTITKLGPNEFYVQAQAYFKDHQQVMIEKLTPTFMAYAEATQEAAAKEVGAFIGMTPTIRDCVAVHLENVARYHCNKSLGRLRDANSVRTGEYAQLVLERVLDEIGTWAEFPDEMALWESVRTNNLIAKATYHSVGVEKLGWVPEAFNANPLHEICLQLADFLCSLDDDCRSEGFYSAWVNSKRSVSIEDWRPSWAVYTPPLFLGCRCLICAGGNHEQSI